MAKVSSTVRTSQVRKDGKVNVKLRIYHKGKTRYIGTRFNVLPAQFSISDGRVKRSHELCTFINKELKVLEAQIEAKILAIPNIDDMTCEQLVERLQKKDQAINFYDMIENKIQDMKPKKGEIERSTWEKYYYTKRNLIRFRGESFLTFREINEGFLEKFFNWHLKEGNSINTAGVDLRNIRTVFNHAIDDRLVSADIYPFRKYRIPKKKTRKRSLTLRQVRKLFKQEFEDFEAQALDIFKLSFFLIGINMKDIFYMMPENIQGDRLVFDRWKTSKEYSIKIYPEAMEIIDRYRDPENVRLLSFYQQYTRRHEFVKSTNKFLKRIAAKTEIYLPVTSYWARHSWATIAFNNDISKDIVTLALGHGSETVTDIYIDFDLKLVDDANRKMIDLVI